MKKWLIALVPAILIVILIGYALGSRAIPQSVQDNLANAASGPDIAGLPDDNLAGALPEAPSNMQPAEAAPDNVATPATDNAATPANTSDDSGDTRDEPDAEAQARREIAATIRKATIAALDNGEPTHWHKDGLQGDIVVSEPQDDGRDGSCRSVSATMGTADDQKQSGDHVWCQTADGGDWTPQER